MNGETMELTDDQAYELMAEYGVELHGRIAELEELVRDMWHELNYTSVRAEDGANGCMRRMAAFDAHMERLGLLINE